MALPVPDDRLAERLATIGNGIADAARAAGRSPGDITTIVVTKFQPVELIAGLAALGVRDVGENRQQEAQAKAESLSSLGLRWHFVGQLQGKKARAVRAFASAVHSVDRERLVEALSTDDGTSLDVFVQLNLTDDPARGGVQPDGLEALAERVLIAPGLNLVGVMAVAPLGEEPRRAFARVREASDRLRALAPQAVSISAGMSGDWADAIAEGATHLRIGTAITGSRPLPR